MGVRQGLHPDLVFQIFQPEGALARHLQGFEVRPQQLDMLRDVIEAYNGERIALIEAGTGTGKSLAYLVPAMLWAVEHQQRTVISTNTINLQEQLVKKDIPFLKKVLDVDVKAVLVKGMGNYLCVRKFEDALEEAPLFNQEDQSELSRLAQWREKTTDGSRASIPFMPTPQTWERVRVEADQCNGSRCPFYEDCFFFKARQQAASAQILVVNHHLLFADLAARSEINNFSQQCVLPAYERVVIDEAHHVEDVATEYFASRVSVLKVRRLLSQIATESATRQSGKLIALREKLSDHYKMNPPEEIQRIFSKLHIDLPSQRHGLTGELNRAFESLSNFVSLTQKVRWEEGGQKLRILNSHRSDLLWKERVVPAVKGLVEPAERYIASMRSTLEDISRIDNPKLKEQLDGVQVDLAALCNRLEDHASTLHNFTVGEESEAEVRWVESTQDTAAVIARLDIDSALGKVLFSRFRTVVLCSATLSTNRDFQFIRRRLGIRQPFIDESRVTEHIYDSPFDYARQALLCVPTHLPSPKAPEFFAAAMDMVAKALEVSHGNAFVLFTSYQMLNQAYKELLPKMEKARIGLMKQGDDSRSGLLTRFVKEDRSVLLGTDSFWEGVDVAGEALRQVIIVKLPFQVPSEPIIEARTERLQKQGLEPFYHYAVPNAIVKFKQGFGRLIRKSRDRGVILCLDSRLIRGSYGKLFVNSLPNCQRFAGDEQSVLATMREFYRKTYRLTLGGDGA